MIKEKINNPERCPRFDSCSINICPLDEDMLMRTKLPEESSCPFTITRKIKSQKGIKTLMPHHLLKFVPKSNIKMLNRRNKKRWHEIHED